LGRWWWGSDGEGSGDLSRSRGEEGQQKQVLVRCWSFALLPSGFDLVVVSDGVVVWVLPGGDSCQGWERERELQSSGDAMAEIQASGNTMAELRASGDAMANLLASDYAEAVGR
jgi:hypothetical protein